jgi:hypothetical protein
MTIRKLDAGRGAGWITDGLAVIKANPGPYLLGCLLVGLISSLPLIGIFFGLLMPVLYGGLVSMLHRQTRGETVAMGQAFDGFQAPGAFMRLLPIVLFNLAFAILLVLALAVTLGAAVYQLIKTGQAGGQPDPKMVLALLPKFALVFLIMLPFCMFVSWMLMLAIPRAMLGNVPGVTALKDAAAAVLANLLPLIVNLLCLMLVMFIIILIMMIPLMLLGALQQHSMALGMLIQIPVMAVFTGGILALYCAIMFQAWREVFADDAIAPPAPTDTFEA